MVGHRGYDAVHVADLYRTGLSALHIVVDHIVVHADLYDLPFTMLLYKAVLRFFLFLCLTLTLFALLGCRLRLGGRRLCRLSGLSRLRCLGWLWGLRRWV